MDGSNLTNLKARLPEYLLPNIDQQNSARDINKK
jgi:hypothetical protein